MQTLLTGFCGLIIGVLLSVSTPVQPAPSTFSELETIRHYQVPSAKHIAPTAKKLHQKFVLWLS